ncbi:MAG: saccharopine dehydrogenase family protein [SAR324 cluster bacterium]|nr:saccharopine dehydrogenase family protein [SAR324 cluster bacterium]MBF0350835.1 saccharopine dehydrogenase family protein [SAR324 cluster bacterium]
MSSVLIVGTGGVGSVVAHKCHQIPSVFSKITLANRTLSKAEAIKQAIGNPKIDTYQVDADNTAELIQLINKVKPELVINTALPYQDLSIMEACLATNVHYLDTANYEHPDEAKFCYAPQWALHERFEQKGLMALLGCGFDPGVTNVYCAYAKKHHFDVMHTIDILDANGGDHGQAFATNFNPEINIREITQEGKYYENREWKTTPPLSVHETFDFPGIGPKEKYLLYHEELESLVKHFPEIKRLRFWMTFSEKYLTHLRVLQAVGMTAIKPVNYEGHQIIPIQFLKAVLPEPSSLGPLTKGKTCIGCIIEGEKHGKPVKYYVYNICDHQECYQEVGSQAISYTTGVPAMIGAKMMLEKKWTGKGVFNVEQFNPDPFMEDLNRYGLPWTETWL